MTTITKVILGIAAGLMMVACGNSSDKVEVPKRVGADQTGNDLSDTQEQDEQPNNPGIDNLEEVVSGKLIDATYAIKVDVLGIGFCKGEVDLAIDPMMGQGGKMFDMPKACMDCMGIKMDLSQALGSMTGGGNANAMELPKIEVEDGVIFMDSLGPVKHDPSRPMFPSFLAASPEELESLNVSRSLRVTNTVTGESGSGTISMRTTAWDAPYSSSAMGRTFKKTLQVEMSATGFDSMEQKVSSLLFEKMDLVVSLDKLAIPKVGIQVKVEDAMAAQEAAGGDGQFDPTQFESEVCGKSSEFMKFVVNQQQNGGLLGGLGGGGGGGLGGGALGSIAKELLKKAKINVELELQRMEGLKF